LRKGLKEFCFEFEKKSGFKKKFEKERKKEQNLTCLPFGPNGPAAHHPSPRAGPRPLSLFLFSSSR
jgi:hypothetical protein